MGSSVRELGPDLAWELACGGPFPEPESLEGPDHFMALALRKAREGVGLASPNPAVGCVIVRDGRVIASGAHLRAGGPHAEVAALEDARGRSEDPRGATAYVTLEPCCHQGRTPPCTDALLRAGIAAVRVGVRDPNPQVAGGGLALLGAAGLDVEEGLLGEACARHHAPFFKLMRTGLPWVVLKLALGSDGSLGPEGARTSVTAPEIQALAHALRRASEAIVVGRRTVEIDDPTLSDRWPVAPAAHRRFHRVVLDSNGSLPADRRIWASIPGQPALRATVGERPALPGVEDLRLPSGPGGCSLPHLLRELASRGASRVLFEGGGRLAEGLLAQGLVDEFHRFQADKPAGGKSLLLDTERLTEPRARIAFPGGTWEILARPLA